MLAGLRKLVESLLRHIVDDRILLFCLSRDRLDRSILAAIQHKQLIHRLARTECL